MCCLWPVRSQRTVVASRRHDSRPLSSSVKNIKGSSSVTSGRTLQTRASTWACRRVCRCAASIVWICCTVTLSRLVATDHWWDQKQRLLVSKQQIKQASRADIVRASLAADRVVSHDPERPEALRPTWFPPKIAGCSACGKRLTDRVRRVADACWRSTCAMTVSTPGTNDERNLCMKMRLPVAFRDRMLIAVRSEMKDRNKQGHESAEGLFLKHCAAQGVQS